MCRQKYIHCSQTPIYSIDFEKKIPPTSSNGLKVMIVDDDQQIEKKTNN